MLDRGNEEDKEQLFNVSKLSESEQVDRPQETFLITEIDGEFVTVFYDEAPSKLSIKPISNRSKSCQIVTIPRFLPILQLILSPKNRNQLS
jgi:hypothetical protein